MYKNYYLMHENIPVAEIELYLGMITRVIEVYEKERLPVGNTCPMEMLPQILNIWQKERSVPKQRQNYAEITDYLGTTPLQAAQESGNFSITDHYWFKELGSEMTWENGCFEKNGFSNAFANQIFRHLKETPDYHIPDIATDGMLKKVWINVDKVSYLLKFGDYGNFSKGKNLLSANEIVAGLIAKEMGLEACLYKKALVPGTTTKVCICENFCKPNEEYITASELRLQKAGQHFDLYEYFKEQGFEKQLCEMLFFDFLIHNTDRHTKNFGILRDAKTLKITRICPIFDNGNSFNWDRKGPDPFTKPFGPSREAQLRMSLPYLPQNIPSYESIKQKLTHYYKEFDIEEEQLQAALEDLQNTYDVLEVVLEEQKNKQELQFD